MSVAAARPHRTTIIAKNTLMGILDVGVFTILGLLVTIPVNRVIGPERLGYFSYIQWIVGSSAIVASLGVPEATRKYMAEFMGSGDHGMARAVYKATLRIQMLLALAVVVIGELLIFTITDPHYWASSALLVLSQFPRLLGSVPSQANNAVERMQANVSITVVTQSVFAASVLFSLWMGWNLVGIAASQVLYISLELWLKMRAVRSWLGAGPAAKLPRDIRRRMISFGGYGIILSLLNLMVWDRSDIVFLRRLDSNPSHMTYFAVALNLNDRVLNLLRTFTTAAAVTITAEYGRNRQTVPAMTAISMRYGLLLATPALAGTAALGGLLATTMYGPAYSPVAEPLLITAILSVFKPLLLPLLSLLQAFERQRVIVAWGCAWALVNVALDVTLIPLLGPSGAALANGVAQTGMVLALWWSAHREFRVHLASGSLLRIFAAAASCGSCAAAARLLPVPAVVQLLSGVAAGFCGFLLAARILRLIEIEDRMRLNHLATRLSGPVSTWADRALRLLMPSSTTI